MRDLLIGIIIGIILCVIVAFFGHDQYDEYVTKEYVERMDSTYKHLDGVYTELSRVNGLLAKQDTIHDTIIVNLVSNEKRYLNTVRNMRNVDSLRWTVRQRINY